ENTGSAWQVSRPSFSDIVWSQQADISVPRLMNKLFTRSITEKSTIDLTRTDSRGSETTYLQLKTEKVAVTGVSLSNGSVSASQAYSKIQMSYTP
ncbi:type VI secretion system tube protein Hcp, partial [Parvimonas sp. M20]